MAAKKGQKWSDEAKASAKAKREAKIAASNSGTTEAIVYLKHAEANINARLADGTLRRMDRAHLLTLLALKTLTEA